MATEAAQVDGLQNAGMTYHEAAALSASMVMNAESRLSIHLRNAFARRLAALRHNAETKKQMGRKKRLILPYVLEPERIYDLTKRYAQFDLVFRQTERVCGGLAKTIVILTVERMFDFVKKSWLSTAAFGFSLNVLVSNNRHWVHLCVPREDIDVSARNVKDDRVMCAVLNSARRKNNPLPMTDMYARGDLSRMCCGDPVTCKFKAMLGIMMLHETDTNYKQVATWMYQHQIKFAYIGFVSTKAIELGYDADIPELDARVVHKGDKYMLLYRNAVSMGRYFSRKNYLTLVGQTHEVIGDYLFTKEFCGWQDAMAIYKITMVKRQFSYETTLYKSWLNVGYDNRYLISSYKVRDGPVDAFDPKSYVPFQFEVDRDLVDKLLSYTRRLEPDVFDHMSIARRLRSLITTTVVGGYSIVSPPTMLSEDEFDHLTLTVYTKVFMENFRSGASLAFQKSEHAAHVYLSKVGMLRLLPYVFNTMVTNTIVVPFKTFFSWLRRLYDKWIAPRRVPLPDIVLASSFVEYNDRLIPTVWSEIGDWMRFWDKPWDGFSPHLPGFTKVMKYEGNQTLVKYNASVSKQLMEAMSTSVLDSDSVSETSSLPSYTVGKGYVVVPVKPAQAEVTKPLVKPVQVEVGRVLQSADVSAVVARIADHQGHSVNLQPDTLVRYVPLVGAPRFQDMHNGIVDQPVQLLPEVMGRIFPESTLMQTNFASADIHYGSMELVARAVRIKIDAAKLSPLRPEKIYRPKMPNQLLPNARQTMQATLPTVVKRNLNTTSSVDPLCVDEMWERTWSFMKIVYYVPDVENRLAEMEDIRPSVENVAIWASKLEPEIRAQVAQRDFTTANLLECMKHSKLMLKAKRKANLGPSYDAAVKAAQSIQFDSSKVRTGVFSSMFQEKVRRDKSVLKDNVFIMQSKSPDDLRQFLSTFTWHDTGRGPLRYMEIDAEMFDKSQILTTLMMHWKKSEKFGMLPSYVELLREGTTYRDASSIQAGVKAFITPQRGSGDSDTLDGNSDVSQVAYARFFASFINQIEFILIMGDDVTVAFRGEVEYGHLEADCMKEFNLSVKLTVSEFGYFVSGWIVHYPDGSISWCTDPIKRAVSLGDQSVNEGVDLTERYVGFNDLCKGLSGYALQSYVAKAAAARYSLALGIPIDVHDVEAAIKCVSTIASNQFLFVSFFSSELFKRTA